MEVSVQFHTLAVLPLGKVPLFPPEQSLLEPNHDSSVAQHRRLVAFLTTLGYQTAALS
jgi:hypothetical protein